ncbi:MAG: glucose-6-phosphate dehydrogenase [Planctomycetota bacterium]
MTALNIGPQPTPCAIVIFGASGDLTKRKLVPALFDMFRQGRLPEHFFVVGVARSDMSDESFRERMVNSCKEHAGDDHDAWQSFSQRLHYFRGNASEADIYPGLTKRLNELGRHHNVTRSEVQNHQHPEMASGRVAEPSVLFYLSVSPNLYGPIVQALGESGMLEEAKRWGGLDPHHVPWQRIIVEKPFGTDLLTARELNQTMGRVFDEHAIYRIDHYLGKEAVQNILVMRFANAIFEPLWSNAYVDHVQVTAVESIGVGRRAGNFYDHVGATRDMLQSHLLQVLALVAMEPPAVYSADAIRAEKIKLIDAARAISQDDAHEHAAFGRYGPSGNGDDEDEGRAYTDIEGVDPSLATETYAAMRLEFDTWRWAGVPFYVRSGKKLARKLTEIVVQFKQPPTQLFRLFEPFASGIPMPGNRIVINIAPEPGVGLRFEAKVPGRGLDIQSVKMDMDYATTFGSETGDAYGPLIVDAMRGDQTLFKHRDEIEGAWRLCDPVINSERLRESIETYNAYSWGPENADKLLHRQGRAWHNPVDWELR